MNLLGTIFFFAAFSEGSIGNYLDVNFEEVRSAFVN